MGEQAVRLAPLETTRNPTETRSESAFNVVTISFAEDSQTNNVGLFARGRNADYPNFLLFVKHRC
jgi:hypothetical protein